MVWEAAESFEAATTAGKVWSVTERFFRAVRLPALKAGSESGDFLCSHLPDVRGAEWNGRRYLFGSVDYSEGDESRGLVWIADLASATPQSKDSDVLQGGGYILSGNSPALAIYGDKLLLSVRPGFHTSESLQFFLTSEVGDWTKEPAFTGPAVLDEYDILAIGKRVWVASRDPGSGALKAWVREESGKWEPVTMTGNHPPTQQWRVWLVAAEPVPEVVYRTDGGEFVRVALH